LDSAALLETDERGCYREDATSEGLILGSDRRILSALRTAPVVRTAASLDFAFR
jgi:hypothetical protein